MYIGVVNNGLEPWTLKVVGALTWCNVQGGIYPWGLFCLFVFIGQCVRAWLGGFGCRTLPLQTTKGLRVGVQFLLK